VGKASDLQKKVYATVLAAQRAALDALEVGVAGVAVDTAARDFIATAGYGDYFGHGTGHGVGLDIHECPNCSPHSSDTLPIGAVVTIEPGIYLPGELGIRIEDLVLVTKQGTHIFTRSDKELIELE
jgi:Xaa-Pro aminopeptidase